MRLPSYPLVTCDPFFSIWSRTDLLTDSDTSLWCGIPKPIRGFAVIDGERFRFLGCGEDKPMKQVSLVVEPYRTRYCFEQNGVQLDVDFWTPLDLSDLHRLSLPVSFIDCTCRFTDGQPHSAAVTIELDKVFCYDGKEKPCLFYTTQGSGYKFAVMGQQEQKPLSKSGDGVGIDWGWFYGLGGSVTAQNGIAMTQELAETETAVFAVGYDEVQAIEYFGTPLPPLWREAFSGFREAMADCYTRHDELLKTMLSQGKRLLDDAASFGKEYQAILTAAARQILAGHKLVRSPQGELLYLSKECHSNGCINTVDVSYPGMPFFLLYRPELVKAMLTGVFAFAQSDLWQADYAPHDIGRYPHANGQVYALRPFYMRNRRIVYRRKRFSIYMSHFQMPVEECGNMLMLSYAYYVMTGDKEQLEENFDLLERWAKYLEAQGVILQNQLCTDDFAGHSEQNVNLAIKGIMGLCCFARIAEALEKQSDAMQQAKHMAVSLQSYALDDGILPFSLLKPDSWSLKYNLVWDRIFGFHLFEPSLFSAESERYRHELNRYGVPLDYRSTFTKSDWLLWAACLDSSGKNVGLFSRAVMLYLAETQDRGVFSDWFDTVKPKQCGFDHRTVQGGLWMPVLQRALEGRFATPQESEQEDA